MISKALLGTVVQDQREELNNPGYSVPRSIFGRVMEYGGSSALVVMGLRRCGKSTLLKQMVGERYKGNVLYLNFDDERITGFRAEDFQTLMEVFIELFGDVRNVFLDEIQDVTGWELFVNRLLRQGYRVFITGSNSNLLSKELGTRLTGRHTDLVLYPFSFAEFTKARKVGVPAGRRYSTKEKAQMSGLFKEYLSLGGMPEAVVFSNESAPSQVLSDVLQKDIVNRHGVRKPADLRAVVNFLVANASNELTVRSILNNFAIRSANTVQKYLEYAEEAYLVFTVRRFERKVKLFDKNPRKVYCSDNGIITRSAPSINERKGALLENLVAVHLKRMGKEFYYYRGPTNSEADFVVPAEKAAIQVCHELNEENRGRELKGLYEAMNAVGTRKGLILTADQEGEISQGGRTVAVLPAWQWLLKNEPE